MNGLLVLLGSFFGLVVFRVPIAFAMGLSSMITAFTMDLPMNVIMRNIFEGVNSFSLLAVPFFLLAGMIMNMGKVTDRLLELSNALVGHIRGGLAHVNVLVSMMFAGISGSPAADTSGIGSIIIPAMVKAGYDAHFSVAITAASSTIGGIIPPSIAMILYGAFGNVSIGALFMGGIIPGILVGLSLMWISYLYARKRPELAGPPPSWKRIKKASLGAVAPLGMPILILGGIIAGVFTATEASVIAVIYGLFLGFFVYRDEGFTLKKMPGLFSESVIFYALSLFAVCNAMPMGWLIAYLDGPEMLTNLVQGVVSGYYGMYIAIVTILLILGTFLSPAVIIVIFLPVLQALGNVAGIHPVHLGVITVMVLGIGQITPPYGICLLIASEIGKVPVLKAFRATLGLIAVFLFVVGLCIIFPDLVLFIPRVAMGIV